MASINDQLKPNVIGTLDDPVNITIMDVDAFIYRHRALPVTSALVLEPSTNNFHPDGFYSEVIFGNIGSPDRMERFGYIDLNTTIFSPKIFKIICSLGKLYKDIMSGAAYAIFDPVTKDFERVVGDPFETPGADTGFSFFLKHFNELSFKKTASSRRDIRIEVVQQYKSLAFQTRYVVEPAGLRDISNDTGGRLIQDEVNNLYKSLLLYTRSIPKGSQSTLYDPIRYQIQSKAVEIFEYIENFLDGKRGFIQGSFARRNIANGTRNVITASNFMAASPEDPQLQKADDVMVGVYQTIKGLIPFTKHAYKMIFADPIFKQDGALNISLSDPETKQLVYTSITPAERDKWVSGDEIDKIVNSFRNIHMRKKPMLVKDTTGKSYALLFVYDEGDEIALCRSIDDLHGKWPRPINPEKLRPITYIEAFYLIAEIISTGKHAIVTRYPVIEQGSSYVAKIHVVSTTPSRAVKLVDLLVPGGESMLMRQYPVLGSGYMDAAMVHPSKLAALGGDHDGDKVSIEYIWGADSNEENAQYLQSPKSVIDTDLRFITGSSNYLVDSFLHSLTHW